MRQYPDAYWNSRAMAPSCVLFFIGVNKPVKNLLHHTLFFDQDMDRHIHEIYKKPQWPSSPQFYVCCPSKTDQSVAPQGCENLFVLIPVAPGLTGTDVIIERYYEMVMRRLERLTGESIREHVIYRKNYGPGDFTRDYHAFKGNAYGLANTLMQTANLKPRIQHKKISNLYYAGQLTVPGPGVPPSLISGQVAAATLSAQHHRR